MENHIEQKNNTQARYILHCASKLKEVVYNLLDGPFFVLLSLGERNHIKKFTSLTQKQWEMIALLQRRVPQNLEKFLDECQDQNQEMETLLQMRLCVLYKNHRLCLHSLSKSELQKQCSKHELPTKGKVDELRTRLLNILPQLELPLIIHVANPKLIERCIAWMNNNHDGSWNRDIQNFIQEGPPNQHYERTKLLPLYTRKFDFWSYYYGRWYFHQEATIERLFNTLPPKDYQFRFSLHRQFFEQSWWENTSFTTKILDRLKQDVPYKSTEVILLGLYALLENHSIKKIQVKSYVRSLDDIDFEIFEMDVRRVVQKLGRLHRLHFFPRYPLQPPKKRHLYLSKLQKKRQRITFEVDDRQLNVEQATIASLKKVHRKAMYIENHGWQSLLHWLFLDIHFECIEGMLPFSNMNHPLDYYLGTSYFERRRFLFENRLSLFQELSKDDDIFFQNINVHFQKMSQKYPAQLTHREEALFILQSFSFTQLIPLLKYLLHNPTFLRGLPDLLVQKQSSATCVSTSPLNIAPPKIPTKNSFFVEVKCRDPVSNSQLFWHHKLTELGFVVEIWNLHETN